MNNSKCKLICTFVVIAITVFSYADCHSGAITEEKGTSENRNSQEEQLSAENAGTESGPALTPNETEEVSQYPDPNTIPYKTRKSLIAHFFSIPATAWHLLWTPLGETVIWAEQNRIPQKVKEFIAR